MTVVDRLVGFVASVMQVGLGVFVMFLLLAVYAGALTNPKCSVAMLPLWLVSDSLLAVALLLMAVALHYGAWCGASLEGSAAFTSVTIIACAGWTCLAGMLLWGCLLVSASDPTAEEIYSGVTCNPIIYWTAWVSVVMQSSGFVGALVLSCVSAIFGANVAYTFLMTNEGKGAAAEGAASAGKHGSGSPLHDFVTQSEATRTGASAPHRHVTQQAGRAVGHGNTLGLGLGEQRDSMFVRRGMGGKSAARS